MERFLVRQWHWMFMLFIAGMPCQAQSQQLPPVGELKTRLEFVDRSLERIPDELLDAPSRSRKFYPYASFPDPVRLQFRYVPGRVAGQAAPELMASMLLKRSKYVWLERHTQKDFVIDLRSIQGDLAKRATRYVRAPEDTDFSISPSDTKFARLTLQLLDELQYPLVSITNFLDRGTKDEMVLLYSDRPCRISGRIDLGRTGTFVDAIPELHGRFRGVYDHEIELPHAGMHWLRIQATAESVFRVSRSNPTGPIVVFALESSVARSPPLASAHLSRAAVSSRIGQ